LLALAEMRTDVDWPFILRNILVGSEELGLLGSGHYVDLLTENEKTDIKAILNFDVLGTGSGVSEFGSPDLTALLAEPGKDTGIVVSVCRGLGGGSSDFADIQNVVISHLVFLAVMSLVSHLPGRPSSSFNLKRSV